jgi:hypothetical protein
VARVRLCFPNARLERAAGKARLDGAKEHLTSPKPERARTFLTRTGTDGVTSLPKKKPPPTLRIPAGKSSRLQTAMTAG